MYQATRSDLMREELQELRDRVNAEEPSDQYRFMESFPTLDDELRRLQTRKANELEAERSSRDPRNPRYASGPR
jgi:hypothetical protein